MGGALSTVSVKVQPIDQHQHEHQLLIKDLDFSPTPEPESLRWGLEVGT